MKIHCKKITTYALNLVDYNSKHHQVIKIKHTKITYLK